MIRPPWRRSKGRLSADALSAVASAEKALVRLLASPRGVPEESVTSGYDVEEHWSPSGRSWRIRVWAELEVPDGQG